MEQESNTAVSETDFNEFYTEVKEIEKRDSVLTPKQQIDRLLRPGSTYFNLNPFEVLQIEPETSAEEAKKKYRRLSLLVHPDKNQDDAERAQTAFEIVNKAWKTLETQETRQKCLDIIEEAKARTDMMVADKRKKLKKDGKSTKVEEDDPSKYKHAVYVMTMKLFADLERKKRDIEERDMQERKRKREKEIEEEEKASIEKEWQKNFELMVNLINSERNDDLTITVESLSKLKKASHHRSYCNVQLCKNYVTKVGKEEVWKLECRKTGWSSFQNKEEKQQESLITHTKIEESREGRVNSWKAFQAGSKKSDKSKVKKFKAGAFKPPKHKAESR